MPQNFSISPRDQFLMSAGSGMLNQPYSVAPQGMAGIGDAVNKGLNVFQTALLAKEEKEERARKQKQISSFVSGLDPNLPPETRKLAGLLAQSPQGQQQLPALLNPEPETFGTQEYENYVTMGAAGLDLPREHPEVQDWAAQKYMAEQQKPKGSLVTISPGDTETQKLAAKRRDEKFGEAMERADTSRSKIQDLGTMHSLLKGYTGGPLSKNVLVPLQGFMTEIGIDPKLFNMNTPTGMLQAAKSMEQRMVLGFRSTAEGAGMPGHLSDRDVRFLEGIPPGLGMTEKGRDMMYKVYAKRYENAIDLERFWLEETAKSPYGAPPVDILQKVQEFKDGQTLFTEADGSLTEFGMEAVKVFNIPGYDELNLDMPLDTTPLAIPPPGNWEEIVGPKGELLWWNPDTGIMKPRG